MTTDEARAGGINVAGYLRTESGVGAAVRGYIRALRSVGLPLALHDLSALQGNRSLEPFPLSTGAPPPAFDLNLICADVELHFAILNHLGEGFFRDHYNVGIWAWELPRFPEKWFDRFAFYDEIWVGSSFIANALTPVSPLPIVRIPPVLTVEEPGSRTSGRALIGARDEFVFLFVFDLHSHLERKNPLALIDAFKRAFAPSEPVRLVLKCVNADDASLGLLKARAQGHPITIVEGYWDGSRMRDLMAACDAYVSLHRSEGTGLTLTEAMAIGKPVIATGWSGNMDFMTVANSFPVSFDLVQLERNVGPYRAGETWADPSVDHAAELMRLVLTRPDEAQARADRARREIAARSSPTAIGDLISERLRAIAVRQQFAEFRQQGWASYADYCGLGERVREAVRQVVPRDATVAVISKGDASLLDLDGRHAWHFPRNADGEYAGYYPGDGAEAITHLELVRAAGASFLILPSTAFWWLDFYPAFREHLEEESNRVYFDEWCAIYALEDRGGGGRATASSDNSARDNSANRVAA